MPTLYYFDHRSTENLYSVCTLFSLKRSQVKTVLGYEGICSFKSGACCSTLVVKFLLWTTHTKHCFPCPAPCSCVKHVNALIYITEDQTDPYFGHITRNCYQCISESYLYCVGSKAVPQWKDAVVFNHLYETVDHSSEMDVDSSKMGKTGALCLLKRMKAKIGNGESEFEGAY